MRSLSPTVVNPHQGTKKGKSTVVEQVSWSAQRREGGYQWDHGPQERAEQKGLLSFDANFIDMGGEANSFWKGYTQNLNFI